MQQTSYETLELIPGGILIQNQLLQTAQPAGATSDRGQTTEAESTAPPPPPQRAVNRVGGLFPGSRPLGLAKEEPEGCSEWLAQKMGCPQDPYAPSKMPLIRPSCLWTPVSRFTSYKGLALSCAICGFAAHMGLLLGSEEAFVCQEGQLLLSFSPSPRTSAAFAGTIFFFFQIGHKNHLRRDTPSEPWQRMAKLWKWVWVGTGGTGFILRNPPPILFSHFTL